MDDKKTNGTAADPRPRESAGSVTSVCVTQPKWCANCRHLIRQTHSLLRYDESAGCAKRVWEKQRFFGDGDYLENVIEKQVCELHTQNPAVRGAT